MLPICQAHSPDWSRKHQLKPPASLWGKPSSSHPNAQHILSSKENQTDGVDQIGIYWAGELKSRKSSPKTSSDSTAAGDQELVSWWSLFGWRATTPHHLGWANQTCPPSSLAPANCSAFNDAFLHRLSSELAGQQVPCQVPSLGHNIFTSRSKAGIAVTHPTHVGLVCPLVS